MGRERKRPKGLKLYVRVFEKESGEKKVVNRTYEIRDYVGYVSMVSELRSILWSVYREAFGADRSGPASSGGIKRVRRMFYAATPGRRRPPI